LYLSKGKNLIPGSRTARRIVVFQSLLYSILHRWGYRKSANWVYWFSVWGWLERKVKQFISIELLQEYVSQEIVSGHKHTCSFHDFTNWQFLFCEQAFSRMKYLKCLQDRGLVNYRGWFDSWWYFIYYAWHWESCP
jgi:hypothetical protein